MQSQSHLNPNDFFSRLPIDLILEILQYLSNEDIKHIARTSKSLNAIVHQHSVYGDALRFMKWQQKEIEMFESNISKFKDNNRVSYFNRQNEPRLGKFYHYAVNLILIFGILFVFKNSAHILGWIQDNYYESMFKFLEQYIDPIVDVDKDTLEFVYHYIFVPIFAISVLAHYCVFFPDINAQANQGYDASIIQQKHLDFLRENQMILKADDHTPALRINVSTLLQMKAALENALSDIRHSAAELNAYLSTLRDSRRNKFDYIDFDKLSRFGASPKTVKYAQHMLGFWMKHVKPASSNKKSTPVVSPIVECGKSKTALTK